MATDIKEGFLCPICMADLGDVIQLQVHFEERHSKEDPVFLQNIKELFGKAKKRILNDDDEGLSSGIMSNLSQEMFGQMAAPPPDHDPVSGVHLATASSSTPIQVRSHTSEFKDERRKKLERNKSTNQTLVRLEKLMKDLPSDPSKRRAHEQLVVPWIDAECVSLCPSCARPFNVAMRRKHHCRICGSVLCNDCSTIVTFDLANKVIKPQNISSFLEASAFEAQKRESSNLKPSQSTPSKLARLKSKGDKNLQELVSDLKRLGMDDEKQFRSCHLCREIIDKQADKVDLKANQHMIVQLYGSLQNHLLEGEELGLKYRLMSESLGRGEEDYDLKQAQALRLRILKIAENIDVISKRIRDLDLNDSDDGIGSGGAAPSGLQLQLQERVRAASVNFVKEGLVGLPGLPSEDEYDRLQKNRRSDAEKKVEEEKRAAKMAKLRFEQDALRRQPKSPSASTNRPVNQGTSRAMKQGNGLVLSSSGSNFTTSDDPLVQQIYNIQHFISEAKRMGHKDEVLALEANLVELQKEFAERSRTESPSSESMLLSPRGATASVTELEDNYNTFKGMFHKSSPNKEPVKAKNDDSENDDDYDASGKNPFF